MVQNLEEQLWFVYPLELSKQRGKHSIEPTFFTRIINCMLTAINYQPTFPDNVNAFRSMMILFYH